MKIEVIGKCLKDMQVQITKDNNEVVLKDAECFVNISVKETSEGCCIVSVSPTEIDKQLRMELGINRREAIQIGAFVASKLTGQKCSLCPSVDIPLRLW